MENKLLSRSEVPVALTWDLSALYPAEEDFYQDIAHMKKQSHMIAETYKGRLTSPEQIVACLKAYFEVRKIMTLVNHYADLAASVDYYDTCIQERNGKTNREITLCASELSFIDSEIIEQPEQVILEASACFEAGHCYLMDLLRQKPHQLHPEAERVLTAYSGSIELPYETYNAAKLADMEFPDFEADGEKFPLGYSLFEDDYEYDKRTAVRHTAFRTFSEKLREYSNVTACAYNSLVQQEKVSANLRGFSTVFEYLLFNQKVSIDLYNRQIDLITTKLAPHMRRYAKLIQRLYKLDKMTYADLKLPLDSDYDPNISIEGSRNLIEKGLSIMGEDYVQMIRDAYTQRWVDFAKNKGKSTGGFCASPYGNHSYILLSWNNRMSDVFTLAHELGHAGHFKCCNAAQSEPDTNVSTYFVEAPSTINELLMAHYLLKTNPDKRFRRWVLSCMISNTYYHNFVTHLLEAAYQREVYRLVEAGSTLQAETLNRIMHKVLADFWGDAVELTEGAELTWMRQPHYYMGLYSYTYSAGLTIATEVCKRIETEGEAAIEDWKKVLSAGSTKTPQELAAMAGVDISTDAPLLDTINTIGNMIDEIIKLTDELEDA